MYPKTAPNKLEKEIKGFLTVTVKVRTRTSAALPLPSSTPDLLQSIREALTEVDYFPNAEIQSETELTALLAQSSLLELRLSKILKFRSF